MKVRLKFCLFLTALLVLDGCMPALRSADEQPAGSESLLEASNDTPAANDPLQQHLRARGRVNPNDLNSAAYTTEGHVPGENPEFHVVRVTEEELQKKKVQIDPAPAVVTPPHKPDVAIAQVPVQAATPVAAVVPGSVAVTSVRTGDHTGKTRLVFDLTGPSGYSYRIDNAALVLRIELTNASWAAAADQKLPGRLLKSYSAAALQGGGSVVEVKLAGPSKLLTSMALPPNETYGHRVFLDIAGL